MNNEYPKSSQHDQSDISNNFDDLLDYKFTKNSSLAESELDEFYKSLDSIDATFSITTETPVAIKNATDVDVAATTDTDILAELDRALANPAPDNVACDELESILDTVDIPADELEAKKAMGKDEAADMLPAGVPHKSGMSPELKALVHNRANELKEANYRNGRKAQAHKKEQREAYAAEILEREGRPVRSYTHHATTEAALEAIRLSKNKFNRKRSANMTPEEKKAKNLHDAERRRQRKAEARAEQEAAMMALPNFGIV